MALSSPSLHSGNIVRYFPMPKYVTAKRPNTFVPQPWEVCPWLLSTRSLVFKRDFDLRHGCIGEAKLADHPLSMGVRQSGATSAATGGWELVCPNGSAVMGCRKASSTAA